MFGRVLLALLIVCPVSCSTEEVSTATVALPTTSSPAETPATTQLVSSTTDLPTPNGVDPDSPCLQRAIFGDPVESEYLLPFPIGEEYWISQSYCFSEGGHSNQLAYDFDMPVGASVLAAREGVVKEVKEDSPDTGRAAKSACMCRR